MQKIRRILAFLLCMAVVLSNVNPMSVFVTPVLAAEEGTETATLDGEGTQESPWLISDAEDFVLMSSLIDSDAAYADDYYQMTNDIDFTDVTMAAIGKTNHFSGVFDGQLYAVKNLTLTDTVTFTGLFAYVENGTVKNLGIEASTITGGFRTGALAGSALNSVIMNCYCDDTVTVNGTTDVGGFLGDLSSSQMYNCYSAATVTASAEQQIAGGLAGAVNTSLNKNNPSKMDNVYSVAKVTGTKAGSITGGLENQSKYPAHLTNVYYCSDLNAIGDGKTPATNGVTKLTEAQVTDGTLLGYLNSNIATGYSTWQAGEDNYPEFAVVEELVNDLEGEGTQESPWLISDAADFVLMSSLIDSDAAYADDYYQMTNDIDFTDVTMAAIGKTNHFSGVFDGQLYAVKNLTLTDTVTFTGLFAYVENGTVKNLGIEASTITGGFRTGALAGSALNSVIMNCYCDDTVTVNGTTDVGGLLGDLSSSQMYNCYSAATVTASAEQQIAGGLAGAVNTSLNKNNPSRMDNVYSVAKVTGAKAGSITGGLENQSSYPAHMTNVYYCGDLNAIGDGKTPVTNDVTKLTESQVTDGTLLSSLNGNIIEGYVKWQAGEDSYPEFGSEFGTELDTYKLSKTKEISDYKNDDLLFSDADRTSQLEALEKAISDISSAEDQAAVDTVVDEYTAFVDSLEVMDIYEIIPSPHSITYHGEYYTYSAEINVVRADGSLDKETIDYINEIFGSENVTFSTEKDDAKLNLYLTSDDKDDAVETWIRETYGEQVNAETLAESEAHVIFADENGISIIGNDAEGLFRGLTTIKFIKEQIEANPKGYRGFVINDYADMAFRGLIEGYYGFPWSWEEKAELLDFGADFKMNKLVYAPKNDPYHLANWKDLYPDESEDPENNIQNVAKAAETARKYKADLVWTAHCFGYTCYDQGGYAASCGENGIRYKEGDENIPGSDINLLKAKFQQLYDVGVRTFGLLLDDCDYGPRTLNTPWPEIYNNDEALTEEVLAETTAIVNIMADWCAEKGDCYDLIFCPASYSLGWMKNSYPKMFTQAYQYQEVSYYDRNFRDNVQIITTGTGTFSITAQTIADRFKTEGVSTETGYADGEERRSPLQWTNYPTVDNGATLDFGPQYNLITDLNPDDMYGIMSNPFQWAQFNKTVIPSICQYTWNLKDYDAEAVYEDSMKYVMDTDELSDAMIVFADHNDKKYFGSPEGTQELRDAITAFKAEISKENADAVLAEINKIVEACKILLTKEKYTTVDMYEQLCPYANALKDLSSSIQKYMQMFEEGRDVLALMYEADELYVSHSAYTVPDLYDTTHNTSTGTNTLLPFANWLRENATQIVLTANPDAEEELTVRNTLSGHIDEQIAAVESIDFYYGHEAQKQELIVKLEELKDGLEDIVYSELPALEELKVQTETLIASYNEHIPIKNANNLVSRGITGICVNTITNEVLHNTTVYTDGNYGLNNAYHHLGEEEDKYYIEFDLGRTYSLEELWVLCFRDERYYYYDIYTSVDGEEFTLLESKDCNTPERDQYFWYDAEGIEARYVRIVGLHNSKNPWFFLNELEIYVTGADYTAVDEAVAKAEALVRENYTSQEALEAVDAAVAAVVRGKDANEQDAVDAMAQVINDAIAALELKTAGTFEDVLASDYYYDAVLWAVENGITSGMTATTFEPGTSCTRAQAVTFLWRAAGCPEPSTLETAFTDISSKDYYYDAVLWAVENGITAGLTPTAFGPKATCTREQIVTFLWREAGKPEPSSFDTTFTDVDPDEYYYSAVLWAVEKGITEGITSTTFDPAGVCTRGEIVTFLYRADAI